MPAIQHYSYGNGRAHLRTLVDADKSRTIEVTRDGRQSKRTFGAEVSQQEVWQAWNEAHLELRDDFGPFEAL
jgi:hypothetical protein